MSQKLAKPDFIGAASSALCALHCMLTPVLFIAKSATFEKPGWWGLIDYVFIVVAFFAIFHTVKNGTKNWMKYALWIVWFLMTAAILNERLELSEMPEAVVYIPALILVGLHLYNHKYCRC